MKKITVVKTVIKIGSIKIDAYSAGEIDEVTGAPINYLSGKGLADSIGLHHDTVAGKRMAQELKAMLGVNWQTTCGLYQNSSGARSILKLWLVEDAKKYYTYHAIRGNEKAARILNMRSPIAYPKTKNKTTEKFVQLRLARRHNGETEVVTPVGNIDILTPNEVIEVKRISSWKSALGQVLAYGHYYPSRAKRIHLFGTVHPESRNNIKEVCDTFGVSVSYED